MRLPHSVAAIAATGAFAAIAIASLPCHAHVLPIAPGSSIPAPQAIHVITPDVIDSPDSSTHNSESIYSSTLHDPTTAAAGGLNPLAGISLINHYRFSTADWLERIGSDIVTARNALLTYIDFRLAISETQVDVIISRMLALLINNGDARTIKHAIILASVRFDRALAVFQRFSSESGVPQSVVERTIRLIRAFRRRLMAILSETCNTNESEFSESFFNTNLKEQDLDNYYGKLNFHEKAPTFQMRIASMLFGRKSKEPLYNDYEPDHERTATGRIMINSIIKEGIAFNHTIMEEVRHDKKLFNANNTIEVSGIAAGVLSYYKKLRVRPFTKEMAYFFDMYSSKDDDLTSLSISKSARGGDDTDDGTRYKPYMAIVINILLSSMCPAFIPFFVTSFYFSILKDIYVG